MISIHRSLTFAANRDFYSPRVIFRDDVGNLSYRDSTQESYRALKNEVVYSRVNDDTYIERNIASEKGKKKIEKYYLSQDVSL